MTHHMYAAFIGVATLLSGKERWTCMCEIGTKLLMLFSHDTEAVSS